MCPNCTFCGEYYDSTALEEGYIDKIGNAYVCYECIDDLAASVGVPALKDEIEDLQSYIDEQDLRIKKLEHMLLD
nr:hypothetical protein [uncultured Methanolobus sp.]